MLKKSAIAFIMLITLFTVPVVVADDWYIDLSPTRIAPTSGEIGYWHNVYIYGTNTGNLCSNSPVDVLVEVFNPDGTYEGTYYTVITPWLQPGEERSNFIRFYARYEGLYRLNVHIDYQDDYTENDEVNNIADYWFESISSDTDGDGTKDVNDACPNTPGYDCNGCPNYCGGCSVMSCDIGSLTPPVCGPDNSQCAQTQCPQDGCYTQYCDLDEKTIFNEDTVSNYCTMDTPNHGLCSENSCTFSCEHDESCDIDDDNDGVTDDDDICPDTPLGQAVDNEGCSCSQKTCDDSNACTDDQCDWPSGYCWFQIDNSNACGSARDCNENHCEGEFLFRYSDDGHDYCRVGECIEYTCEEDVMYSADCDTDDDDDGDPDVTDCQPTMPQIHHGAEELCNNVDDDCDGVIDMMSQDCEGSDVGACQPGTKLCSHGNWGQCTGQISPVTEICDGIDNDCDGQTDEGCPCVVGETRDCSLQEGICSGATQYCSETGWSECQYGPDYEVSETLCDALDNDCDGIIDNMQRDCSLSYMGLCGVGTQTCTMGSWFGCPAPVTEVCDGLYDEDCDGVVDNDCDCTDGQTQTCGSNVGICEFGTRACTLGSWDDCIGGINPTVESCNGLDDDCDGTIDEGCDCIEGQMMYCGSNMGLCEWGIKTCFGGSWGSCIGGVQPESEICNGLDDDCDGRVDDGVCFNPSHDDIFISGINFVNGDWLIPGDELIVVVTIKNRGNSNLDDVKITGYVDDLGLRERKGPFDIDDGKTVSKTLRFEIPTWAYIGMYDFRLSITNDKMRRVKYRPFSVVDTKMYCGEASGQYCSLFT